MMINMNHKDSDNKRGLLRPNLLPPLPVLAQLC